MQDRYAGDVADYGKYGLLRALCPRSDDGGALRIGVAWYRVPNESGNNDGRHIGYLSPRREPWYRPCDKDLYDRLRRLVADGDRSVTRVRHAGILPAGTRYAEEPLSFRTVPPRSRPDHREAWFAGAIRTLAHTDMVLVAADNGLEIPSVPMHGLTGPKYAYYSDLERFAAAGRSLLVYQHLDRSGPAARQIRRRMVELGTVLPGAAVEAFRFHRGSGRVFYLIPAPTHRRLLGRRVALFKRSAWIECGHFSAAASDG